MYFSMYLVQATANIQLDNLKAGSLIEKYFSIAKSTTPFVQTHPYGVIPCLIYMYMCVLVITLVFLFFYKIRNYDPVSKYLLTIYRNLFVFKSLKVFPKPPYSGNSSTAIKSSCL